MERGTPFAAAHSFGQTGPFRPRNLWGENVVFAGSRHPARRRRADGADLRPAGGRAHPRPRPVLPLPRLALTVAHATDEHTVGAPCRLLGHARDARSRAPTCVARTARLAASRDGLRARAHRLARRSRGRVDVLLAEPQQAPARRGSSVGSSPVLAVVARATLWTSKPSASTTSRAVEVHEVDPARSGHPVRNCRTGLVGLPGPPRRGQRRAANDSITDSRPAVGQLHDPANAAACLPGASRWPRRSSSRVEQPVPQRRVGNDHCVADRSSAAQSSTVRSTMVTRSPSRTSVSPTSARTHRDARMRGSAPVASDRGRDSPRLRCVTVEAPQQPPRSRGSTPRSATTATCRASIPPGGRRIEPCRSRMHPTIAARPPAVRVG